MIKKILITTIIIIYILLTHTEETINAIEELPLATNSAQVSTPSATELEKIEKIRKEDVTNPEEGKEKEELLAIFNKRPASSPNITNFIAYFVQYAVTNGVPANTVILILLLPFIATIVAFIWHVVGLPSLGMLVSISLSITLLATGITVGLSLLTAILFASTMTRILLKKVRVMQLPKMALSVFFVSIFLFIALSLSATAGILTVKQISIFPVLLLIILSERIVLLQLERNTKEVLLVTLVTLGIGILGFFLLSSPMLRTVILLYPEVALTLIPINVLIGRYFGLRLTEYFRFYPIRQTTDYSVTTNREQLKTVSKHGSQ